MNVVMLHIKLERAVDGALSQMPTLKILTPQHPQVPPLANDSRNRIKIMFNMFSLLFVTTHAKFGIKMKLTW